MFKIVFYKDRNGNQPVKEYLYKLKCMNSKDSKIKLNKIQDSLEIISECGTMAGMPFVKHIDGEIWELRPLRDRIFFFCYHGDTLVLLHYFLKDTQRTPTREIEKAKRNLKDFNERIDNNEK